MSCKEGLYCLLGRIIKHKTRLHMLTGEKDIERALTLVGELLEADGHLAYLWRTSGRHRRSPGSCLLQVARLSGSTGHGKKSTLQ